jgi:hypothetical protein
VLLLIWTLLLGIGLIASERQLTRYEPPSVPGPVPVLPCPTRHPHRRNQHCNGDQPDRPADFDG